MDSRLLMGAKQDRRVQ